MSATLAGREEGWEGAEEGMGEEVLLLPLAPSAPTPPPPPPPLLLLGLKVVLWWWV